MKTRHAPPHRAAVRRWIAKTGDPRPNPIGSPCVTCGAPARLALIHHPRYFGRNALRPPPAVCSWDHYLKALSEAVGRDRAFRLFFTGIVQPFEENA